MNILGRSKHVLYWCGSRQPHIIIKSVPLVDNSNVSCSGLLGVLFSLHNDLPDNLVGSISPFPHLKIAFRCILPFSIVLLSWLRLSPLVSHFLPKPRSPGLD